ncbi:MAG: protein kinase [Myxococcales bacterium]|nr:protein kinase [Myxococcales bacterium]
MSEYAASESGVSLLNQKLGKWHLQRKLGEGGMSIVYLGYDPLLEQKGAVKVMRPEMLQNKDVLERFRREAKATNKLHHPNIIQVYDFAEATQVGYYMVLEYLEGQEMAELMQLCPLPIDWIMGVLEQVCAGLSATHKAGIIHRDLKPSNIFLLPNEPYPTVKILDFGIAKQQKVDHQLTRTGTIMGTPAYLAPEQMISQKEIAHAESVDIYALGVILYQLLTGKLPLERENLLEFLYAIANDDPQKLGYHRPELRDTELEALIARMLRKNPADRPKTMKDVWSALQKAGKSFEDPLEGVKIVPSIKTPPPFTPPPQSLSLPTVAPLTPPSIKAPSGPSTPSAIRNRQTPLPTGMLEEPLSNASTLAFEDTSTNDLRSSARQASSSGEVITQSPFSSAPNLPNPLLGESPQDDTFTTQRMEVPPGHTESRKGLFVGLVLVLFLGIAGGWFGWNKYQTKPVAIARVTPPPRPAERRRSFLDGLLADAGEAYQRKDYGKAIELWKRAAKDPNIEQKEGLGNIYRGIGTALALQGKKYAAMMYFRRYLTTPTKGDSDVKERERVRDETLPQMERDFEKRMKDVRGLIAQFKRQARARKMNAMYQTYRKIKEIAPSAPSVHSQVAELLEGTLPYHALDLYDRILRDMELTPSEYQKIKAEYTKLQKSLKGSEEKIEKDLQALSSRLTSKHGASKVRRQLERMLRKDPQLLFPHKAFHRVFGELVQRDPQSALSLLKSWQNSQAKLEKHGFNDWKEETTKKYISHQELQERQSTLSQLRRLALLRATIRSKFQQGAFSDVAARYKEFQKRWEKIKSDPWGDRARAFPRLSSYAELPPGLSDLSTSYKRLQRYRDEGVFTTFLGEYQRFNGMISRNSTLLSTFFSPDAPKTWRKKAYKLKEACDKGRSLLSQGKSLLKKQKWQAAEDQFKAFLQLFPQFVRLDWLNKQIRTCQCARGVTWVSCDDIKVKKK